MVGENSGVVGSNPPHRTTSFPAHFTPRHVADQMIEKAALYPGMTVLDPSAGYGGIVLRPELAVNRIAAFELNAVMAAHLKAHLPTGDVRHVDFLRVEPPAAPDDGYDAVLMNPPGGRDTDLTLRHIHHAAPFVKVGGKLVALLHAEAAWRARGVFGGLIHRRPANEFHIDHMPVDTAIWVATR